MDKKREIKRLAEKAVRDMIDELYNHIKPVGSLCVQIATNELPPDQIPILHITNSEIVVEGAIHAYPIRYTLAPEYFGEKLRNRMLAAFRRKQLEADNERSSAQKFVDILKVRGVDQSIIFLEETGFSDEGIKRVLTAVLNKIQNREKEINPPRASAEELLNTTGPVAPPPQPEPIADPIPFRDEMTIRHRIRNNEIQDVVDQFDEIINANVHEAATRRDDLVNIPNTYANDQQVQACRIIRSYFDDVSTVNFIGYSQKIELSNRSREQNVSNDVMSSMIAMFNNIRQVAEQQRSLSSKHRLQAKALIHYIHSADVTISIQDAGRLSSCGELIGIYAPYIVEEIAMHNSRVYDLTSDSVEEVDTVSDEDLGAAEEVYDRLVTEENRESLYNQMEERRQQEERGESPVATEEQIQPARVVNHEMEERRRIDIRLLEIDPDGEYRNVIEEYYNNYIPNIGWISDPDRSYLCNQLCHTTSTSRFPDIMHNMINVLNERENLPPNPEEEERQVIDTFRYANSRLRALDPHNIYRTAIQDHYGGFIFSIGWIDAGHRSSLTHQVCVDFQLEPEIMDDIINYLNSRQDLPNDEEIDLDIDVDNTIERIDIDDAALRLFAHVTGTTNNDIDSIGPVIGPALAEELYESSDRHNIPRNSMRLAILTYDQIHENESMDGYEEEQSRQSDVFIDLNYNTDEIINDEDRIVMMDRARLLAIDTEIFSLSIDIHNRNAQLNALSDIPQQEQPPPAVDDPHPSPHSEENDSSAEIFEMRDTR